MDVRDGKIYTREERLAMQDSQRRFLRQMGIDPTPQQMKRRRIGRNDLCGCGSGIKFKKCCLQKTGR